MDLRSVSNVFLSCTLFLSSASSFAANKQDKIDFILDVMQQQSAQQREDERRRLEIERQLLEIEKRDWMEIIEGGFGILPVKAIKFYWENDRETYKKIPLKAWPTFRQGQDLEDFKALSAQGLVLPNRVKIHQQVSHILEQRKLAFLNLGRERKLSVLGQLPILSLEEMGLVPTDNLLAAVNRFLAKIPTLGKFNAPVAPNSATSQSIVSQTVLSQPAQSQAVPKKKFIFDPIEYKYLRAKYEKEEAARQALKRLRARGYTGSIRSVPREIQQLMPPLNDRDKADIQALSDLDALVVDTLLERVGNLEGENNIDLFSYYLSKNYEELFDELQLGEREEPIQITVDDLNFEDVEEQGPSYLISPQPTSKRILEENIDEWTEQLNMRPETQKEKIESLYQLMEWNDHLKKQVEDPGRKVSPKVHEKKPVINQPYNSQALSQNPQNPASSQKVKGKEETRKLVSDS